jgi:DnaK suppressor protein
MAKTMTKKQFEKALLERRETVEAELSNLNEELRLLGGEQDNEASSLGNHMADDGSNVQEQERILRVSSDLGSVLEQVNQALERIGDGTYGTCVRCEKPINRERLEFLPYAAYCIDCQSVIERQNGGW